VLLGRTVVFGLRKKTFKNLKKKLKKTKKPVFKDIGFSSPDTADSLN